jgi:hypothetical protein
MNMVLRYILRGCRVVYRGLFLDGKKYWSGVVAIKKEPAYVGQAASDVIFELLSQGKPCMVGRFGTTEMFAYTNCVEVRLPIWERVTKYIRGENYFAFWDKRTVEDMYTLSGFFPATVENIERFAVMLKEDARGVDVLGSWLKNEALFEAELGGAKTVRLEDLDPFRHKNPWSRVLAGKRVLVVHPFAETIEEQYARRVDLFADPNVLPKFELLTYKSVVSFGENSRNTGFETWFDALEHMKQDIDKMGFDVAIIGCGAYGFHLAAHIKRSGRQAVHLGGATQLLFGVIGRRWETHASVKPLINAYWVRPKQSEVPKNHKIVEEGCYW